ncbi:uncharacterized protein MELLADRAFT_96040 [Melampsora larici-populina 98AG31]|uniref:Uncharacterized protein n=1 Tax=Melampsora larici-populina (strain 98AG31 / pathotype 3-4-7) TaxID=747676 RepID=F4SAP3_MELLP|nr:uncharacterized protein MELLADRAFT_96040 [Melampsora larici-populina 98AG31]EGF98252.1 hypothetical protein MELLADRAFT_96040 [Melampsora larici-populina 98AG31]
MDVDSRSIYSKREIGEKIAQYLAEQGLQGRDGKGVETQIRTLEGSFTIAHDFCNGTGQGILADFEQEAPDEKVKMGYLDDSDEWKAVQHSLKSKFEQLVLQRCLYYYDLIGFMSTRTNVIPQDVRESGQDLDEASVLPSTKRARNQSPNTNVSKSQEINSTQWESPLDPDDPLENSFSFLCESHDRETSPTPNSLSEKESARRPPGRPPKRSNTHNINNQLSRSASSSASDVNNLLAAQLPSCDKRAKRNKMEKDRWNFEEKFMKAEQEARKEEIKTQAKLAEAVSRHLSGGDEVLDSKERAERSQIKLEQDRVQLELTQSQLARSCEDLITARSERHLAMLGKYRALGFSLEEAKKEVEEAEKRFQNV